MRMIRSVALLAVVFVAAAGLPLAALALPAAKPPRIGIVFFGSASSPELLQVLLNGLRGVGLAEGRSAVFEIRYAEGRTDRFLPLTTELVGLGVDLLITTTTPGALAAKQYRRGAAYVDKVFKGTRPADLPFEQVSKFELVINLKTAKSIGVTVPRSLLLRADQLIE